jgi:histidine phosphatase superfamily protein (branch 1)
VTLYSNRHRFRYVAAGLVSTVPLLFGSATAWAEESVVIDFLRHGQDAANAAGVIETTPPGDGLTAEGLTQATNVGEALSQQGPYAGLYASELFRTQETADIISGVLQQQMPFQDLPIQDLSGLNEINAGIYEGSPVASLPGLLYLLTPVAWVLGAEFVPIPGSTTPNGIAFDESFSNAVQTIYDNTVSATGSPPSDVAVSSEGAISTWALMNVNNPDFSLVLKELLTTGQFLPNGAQVVVEGDPQAGWTLVSFDGQPVPPASLPTELFVDARNLVEAPQFASYDIYEALLSGDSTTITSAIDAGLNQVVAASEQFPGAVIGDLVNALGGDSLVSLSDLGNLLPNIGTDLAGALPGELAAMAAGALTSF